MSSWASLLVRHTQEHALLIISRFPHAHLHPNTSTRSQKRANSNRIHNNGRKRDRSGRGNDAQEPRAGWLLRHPCFCAGTSTFLCEHISVVMCIQRIISLVVAKLPVTSEPMQLLVTREIDHRPRYFCIDVLIEYIGISYIHILCCQCMHALVAIDHHKADTTSACVATHRCMLAHHPNIHSSCLLHTFAVTTSRCHRMGVH